MKTGKWEWRFMELAKLVASWSKDADHKVGAIIVNSGNRVLGMGYNGPPRNTLDKGLQRKSEVLRTLHAELNAILDCDKDLKGTTMYIYPFFPCAQCAAAIVQRGIENIFYSNGSSLPSWEESQNEARKIFNEVGVCFEQMYLGY